MNQWRKIAGLDCLVEEGDSTKAAVILHGFGADAYDLYPLHEFFQFNGTWYFPNGILPVPFGNGMEGRAWFPISVAEKLQEALRTGNWDAIESYSPPGLEEAFQKINQFLDEIPQPYENIVLGGFSQGAMLSLEIFLRRKEKPAKLILMSGTLLHQNKWMTLAKEKSGFEFFQSHGNDDPILPFPMAKKLNQLLNDSGMKGKLHAFTGGHTIPPAMLNPINEYLRK
jgi:phospholipase/carboxylesterase